MAAAAEETTGPDPQQELVEGLRRVTSDLHGALERFRSASRLDELAQREVPNARARLAHVLKMTEEAAHRTLDLVEQSVPIADRRAAAAQALLSRAALGDPAFLAETAGDMQEIRSRLSEVLLAQGYQDLTGQILRGVMRLVDEIEVALLSLVELTGDGAPAGATARAPQTPDVVPAASMSAGMGPVVPGVDRAPALDDQQDVDDLLARLGV